MSEKRANPCILLSSSLPDPGVFESQVIGTGRILELLGFQVSYRVMAGLRDWARFRRRTRAQLDGLRGLYGIDLDVIYSPSPISGLGIRFSARRLLNEIAGLDRRVVIWARGQQAACVALEARDRDSNAVVIFDARGDTGAEALLIAQTAASNAARAAWIRRAKRLEELESTAARFSDHRFAVSEALAERLGSMAPIPPEQISVVPCSVDAERFRSGSAQRREVREELGIRGRTVFIYSGSLGSYQIPATIAEIFSEVCNSCPTAHLLVLSRDIEGAARYFGGLRSRGLSTHISAPYDQVGRYLWAGDVGLLLRNPDPVNAVASPVKLGEYLAAGLPVIASRGIGDVDHYLSETGHGLVIEMASTTVEKANAILEWLPLGLSLDRQALSARATSYFSRESHIEKYRAAFRRLGCLVEA